MMRTKMIRPANQIRLFAATAAAVLLLAGCEKESNNIVENGPVAARITSTIIRQDPTPDTRAAGTSWASGDAIGISGKSGSVTYTNVKFVTNAGDGVFTADGGPGNDIYFQDRNDVEFTAYYPHSGTTGTRPDNGGILQHTFTDADQSATGQAKYDFLFARATGNSSNPDVKFRFNHCMSRLVLSFLPGDGIATLDDIEYKLSGMALQGTFNTLTGEAIATGDLSGMIQLTVPGNSAVELASPIILFPQQSDTDKTLTLTMRGTTYNATFKFKPNAENNNVRELASGYSYIYNVKINNTTMTITPATIAAWGNGGGEDINSTN